MDATSTPISVENALATGVSSDARSAARLLRLRIRFAVRTVERFGGQVADRARGAGERLHGEQITADIRVLDDRAHALGGGSRRAALASLLGISERLLVGALRDGDALDADIQPRVVHHREHAVQAAIFLADEPADGAAAIAVDHRAGRRRMDAELVLDCRCSARRCAFRRAGSWGRGTARCRAYRAARRAGAPARSGRCCRSDRARHR